MIQFFLLNSKQYVVVCLLYKSVYFHLLNNRTRLTHSTLAKPLYLTRLQRKMDEAGGGVVVILHFALSGLDPCMSSSFSLCFIHTLESGAGSLQFLHS